MTRATAWRWCAAAGMAAFLCSWGFGRIPGLVACGPSGGLGPILAFEFVRSPTDVGALFGAEPCRSTLARAQTIALLLVCLAFIPAYSAFLCFAVWAAKAEVWHETGGYWSFSGERLIFDIVVVTVLLAGLADEIEGGLLYRTLVTLPGEQSLINALWWAVHLKFMLLALGTIAIGFLVIRRRWFVRILAALVIAGGVLALRKLTSTPDAGMMMGFTIAWISLLLIAVLGAWRPSLFSAP